MSFSIKNIFKRTKAFKEPGNTAVFTTIHVMREDSLITFVSHELDGDWQFMGDEPFEDYTKVAMVVSLDEIVMKDKSVLELADLPYGFQATRQTINDRWEVEKIIYSDSEIEEMGFYCADCGKYHREIPMNYGAKTPAAYFELSNHEKEASELTQDFCVINDEKFFIKGQVQIKVEEKNELFSWNVWIEISEDDFVKEQERWTDENRFLSEPYPGVLNTILQPYPETLGLEVMVQTEKPGTIPSITINETNHPLYF